jgi:hypothetical protein
MGRIVLKNSKSEISKFSARNANCREFILDWVLRAISDLHMAGVGIWLPPGQKLQPLLYGPDIFLTPVKMEFSTELGE